MKISTVLTLEVRNPGVEPEKYYCKVIEKEKDYFLIDYPVHTKTKKTKFFPTNTTFFASFVGDDEVIYQFSTKIVERIKLNIPAIKMTLPAKEDFHRIQRREFVRVDASIDTAVHSLDKNFKPFTTVSIDISGGGMSFINTEKVNLMREEIIELWFVLTYQSGEIHYVQTKAKIVFLGTRNKLQTVAVKFIDMQTKDQQMIVRFSFEKQREMKKMLNLNRK